MVYAGPKPYAGVRPSTGAAALAWLAASAPPLPCPQGARMGWLGVALGFGMSFGVVRHLRAAMGEQGLKRARWLASAAPALQAGHTHRGAAPPSWLPSVPPPSARSSSC